MAEPNANLSEVDNHDELLWESIDAAYQAFFGDHAPHPSLVIESLVKSGIEDLQVKLDELRKSADTIIKYD